MNNHLAKRNGVYYVRKRVPTELRKAVGKTEIKRSLGTKDRKEAQRLLIHELAEIEHTFDRYRKPQTQKDVDLEQGRRLISAIFNGPDPDPIGDHEIMEYAIVRAKNILEFDDECRHNSDVGDDAWDRWWEKTADAEQALRNAYSRGKVYEFLSEEIQDMLTVNRLTATFLQERQLANNLAKTILPALDAILKRKNGDFVETEEVILDLCQKYNVTLDEVKGRTEPDASNNLLDSYPFKDQLVSRAVQHWDTFFDEFHHYNKSSDDLKRDYDREFNRLKTAIGLKPICTVTRPDMLLYEEIVISEVKPKGGKTDPARDTLTRSYSCIRTYFDWAWRKCLIYDNPAAVLRPPKEGKKSKLSKKRLPWSKADLAKIFNAPLYTGVFALDRPYDPGSVDMRDDSRYWMGLVALMTGGRIGELKQLLLSDVFHDNDITYLNICIEPDEDGDDPEDYEMSLKSEGNDKSLKTEHSIRVIPVHPILVQCGFLSYLNERKSSGEKYVFADLGYSQFFNNKDRFFHRCGVKTSKKSFHSFRHNFRDMVRTLPSDETRNRLLGHAPATAGQNYGSKLVEDEARMFFEHVSPPVDLSHLYIQ